MSQPIGLFDSGIGGGSVLRELRALLPAEDLLFLADQAHVPYGPRPADELRRLSLANVGWLAARGAKLVVVACNTASAAALGTLRASFPHLPFVGMVPAVKPAVSLTRSGVIGVLATAATVQGGLLDDVVQRFAGDVRVLRQPCSGLVDQIEVGAVDHPQTEALLRRYLAPLLEAGADTIVLGCTHYPFVAPAIRRIVGPGVALIDAAPAVAAQTARCLDSRGIRAAPSHEGQVTYATTGDPAQLAALVALLELPPGTAFLRAQIDAAVQVVHR